MKLKKQDEVKIIRGKDKGKSGKIEKLFPKEEKVLVTGINQYKRHIKARSQGQQSEIVTITKPLPVANVSLVCPKCREVTRVGYVVANKSKERICKKCKEVLS